MEHLAIETRGLRKSYRSRHGRQVALDGLDLEVPRGGVHGLLGPNGSGKTTTIRMLLGLARADSGSMRLLGHEVPRELPTVIAQIGAIVECPKFFPPFSGQLNLQLAADAAGIPPRRVAQVLDQVGLGHAADQPYRSYSLGMQQRLAVAATLLKDPELLIFDEPTNGLDPAGIHEVRETIRRLGREGRTVVVSSHLLSEVQQIADTVSIIAHGRLLVAGTTQELMNNNTPPVRVVIDDAQRARQVLGAHDFLTALSHDALLVHGVADASLICRLLADEGLYPREIIALRQDLEQVYLALTDQHGLGPRHGPGIGLPARSNSSRDEEGN